MSLEDIRKLREETGAGVMDAKKALEEASGDMEKAKDILKTKGLKKAAKKSEREIKEGRVFTYVHGEGRVGAMLKLGCETDFVAKNEKFAELGSNIVMQIAAMAPESKEELLEQPYIKDSKKKVSDLLSDAISTIGENITIEDFARLEI